MKISIDTDVDSFDSAISAVRAAYGRSLAQEALTSTPPATASADDDDDGEDGYLPGLWTPGRIKKLVEWLGESDAAAAVRYIAENAPAVSLDSTFAHMAKHTGIATFDGRDMGGRMSSVGFARKNIGGGVGAVYETDYNARKYRMNKKVAAAILEAMDAYAER